MPDPIACNPCDAIVIEATYGDRLHRPVEESRLEFIAAVKEAMERGGNVVIPSFALERSQDVLFYLHQMWDAGEIGANSRIFLDSPLAISITEANDTSGRSTRSFWPDWAGAKSRSSSRASSSRRARRTRGPSIAGSPAASSSPAAAWPTVAA
jgi:Cft2 family RNA processing exonuclease